MAAELFERDDENVPRKDLFGRTSRQIRFGDYEVISAQFDEKEEGLEVL